MVAPDVAPGRLRPAAVSELLEKARYLLSIHRGARAAECILEHLRDWPDDADALALLALAHLEQGDAAAAESCAHAALAIDPDGAAALHALAYLYMDTGRQGELRQVVDRLLALDPDSPAGWHLRALGELAAGNRREALVAVERAIELEPGSADLQALRAEVLRLSGRRQEAQHAVREALALDPESAAALRQRARELLRAGEAAAASAHYLQVLRRKPEDDEARRGLLESLRARSRFYRVAAWARLALRDLFERHAMVGVIAFVLVLNVAHAIDPVLRPVLFGMLLLPTVVADFALLWHPIGRHTLSHTDKITAVLVVPLLVAGAWLGARALLGAGDAGAGDAGAHDAGAEAATICLGAAVLVAAGGFAIDRSDLDRAARRRVAVLLVLAAALVVVVVLCG